MKRLLIFLVAFGLALAVCGALITEIVGMGSGGIGSVSFDFSEVIVGAVAAIVLVPAFLVGRALLMRFRDSDRPPKS